MAEEDIKQPETDSKATEEDKKVEDTHPTEDKTQDDKEDNKKVEDNPSEEEAQDEPSDATNANKPSEDVDYAAEEPQKVVDALKDVGFDYNALVQEYANTGAISPKTRTELAKVGITDVIIDNYINGMKAKAEQDYNEISEVVGGRENFDTIIKWAAHNLDPEEIKSINAVTDKFQVKSILRDLKVRMEEKEGVTPNYQKGDGDKPAVQGYRSQAEMFEAIKDPKYKKDEAYRNDVLKKIAASREAGVDLGIY